MGYKIYIYEFINLINGHKYVGQSKNVKRRCLEHKSNALNPNHKDYNNLFHKKLREYGFENFSF